VIALRHVQFEDLGLLANILHQAGWAVSYREAPIDDLSDRTIEDADLLVVLGGPIGVYEIDTYSFLSKEINLLARRLAKNRPTLGICLGAQLMAKALGSRIFAGPTKEIGWGRVVLTGEGRASCLAPLASEDAKVLHWHRDTFDLPHGAVRLASNQVYENQAFAYGSRSLALPFHLEADPSQLEEWYVGHAVELAGASVSILRLRAEAEIVAGRSRIQAERVFKGWLHQIG
jgi:GMP synthase (glutamine-hydrolysing)